MAKKKRVARRRSVLRELERKHARLIEDRERLRLLEPGGSPERPLEVGSASVVEARAEDERCFECDAGMRCMEHGTLATSSGLVRVVTLRCPQCGAPRTLYVRIVERYLN